MFSWSCKTLSLTRWSQELRSRQLASYIISSVANPLRVAFSSVYSPVHVHFFTFRALESRDRYINLFTKAEVSPTFIASGGCRWLLPCGVWTRGCIRRHSHNGRIEKQKGKEAPTRYRSPNAPDPFRVLLHLPRQSISILLSSELFEGAFVA